MSAAKASRLVRSTTFTSPTARSHPSAVWPVISSHGNHARRNRHALGGRSQNVIAKPYTVCADGWPMFVDINETRNFRLAPLAEVTASIRRRPTLWTTHHKALPWLWSDAVRGSTDLNNVGCLQITLHPVKKDALVAFYTNRAGKEIHPTASSPEGQVNILHCRMTEGANLSAIHNYLVIHRYRPSDEFERDERVSLSAVSLPHCQGNDSHTSVNYTCRDAYGSGVLLLTVAQALA